MYFMKPKIKTSGESQQTEIKKELTEKGEEVIRGLVEIMKEYEETKNAIAEFSFQYTL